MAHVGPIWYVDKAGGFNDVDNGTNIAPLETIAYAISRIVTVGFGSTGHTIMVKKNGAVSYGVVDATPLTPTPTNQFILAVWDAENNGIPFIDNVSVVSNMVVEGFWFERTTGELIEVGTSLTTIENVLIRTNVFNQTGSLPKHIQIGGANLTDIDNLKIIQNTFIDRDTNLNTGMQISWGVSPNGILNSVISNNIFYRHDHGILSNSDITAMSNDDLVITNNCFFDISSNISFNTPSPINSITSDPLFENYGTEDYHLQDTSPCLDAGTNIEVTNVDIEGLIRPIYQTWDIGAYEIQATFLSQMIGGNHFDKGAGVTKTSVVSVSHILALPVVSADSNFDNESLWGRVITVYKHSGGQRKVVSHLSVGGTWQGQIDFSGDANTGDWEKREIILIDKDGDSLAIDRGTITNVEDLVIS